MNNKKGSIFAWFMVTVAVFTIAIFYMILTQPIIAIQAATNETLNDPNYASSYNKAIVVWKYWPIVMLLGLIIVGIIYSLKREPYTGYE
jgi:heme/copper-type cytochrome/quinol oxidase subunit 2